MEDLAALDPEASRAAIAMALDEIRERYDTDGHGVELVELAGGWQILTRPEYTETIEGAQLAARPQRLSAAALETLAIIAYRQPIGRAEIEEIRGVSVGGMLKTLMERGLIDVVGRAEGLGRPLLYGTTPVFLEQFALRHLGELPRADELAVALRAEPRPL
jgi:segregation and condensation protein B